MNWNVKYPKDTLECPEGGGGGGGIHTYIHGGLLGGEHMSLTAMYSC